jgi:hypothetical protein
MEPAGLMIPTNLLPSSSAFPLSDMSYDIGPGAGVKQIVQDLMPRAARLQVSASGNPTTVEYISFNHLTQ